MHKIDRCPDCKHLRLQHDGWGCLNVDCGCKLDIKFLRLYLENEEKS